MYTCVHAGKCEWAGYHASCVDDGEEEEEGEEFIKMMIKAIMIFGNVILCINFQRHASVFAVRVHIVHASYAYEWFRTLSTFCRYWMTRAFKNERIKFLCGYE